MRTKARENYQKMSGRSLQHLDSNANTEELMLRDNMSPAEQLNIDEGNDTDSGCETWVLQKEHGSVACVSLMLRLPNITTVTVGVDFSLR
ncbi:hypothetical protein Nepgr_031945 [Nepenthes gracilis]|uniref:Uncharacterized protein n=1 Tax=Nepenthes gracilis TaxID=150966 RepID=A0AAD3Y589_NEPGR|nr:hypothetical protein Nepgr_031945 [Nepenthes gracilis]